MSALHEIYLCKKCGNVVEVLRAGTCVPACCGEPMKLMREGETDGASEKHVPVLEKTSTGWKVRVGSAAHPMQEDHYIEWIELLADGVSLKRFLRPGDAPEAEFRTDAEHVTVREYCNKHGLWKAEV